MMMNNSFATIENLALKLLQSYDLLTTPIDVRKVASKLDIQILEQDLDDDVSGFLVRKDNKNVIGLNNNQHDVRQRFTISHEIGHFKIHVSESLFVDYYKGSRLYRSSNHSNDFKAEREANVFAAALLMPEPLIIDKLKSLPDDISYERKLKHLSSIFVVSQQAMDFRLKSLGLYDYGL